MNSYIKQSGVFVIEFTMMLFFMILFLFFTAQLAINMSIKGQLDSISFFTAGIIRERLQLFSNEEGEIIGLNQKQLVDMRIIASTTLSKSIANFDDSLLAITIEEYNPNDGGYIILSTNGAICQPNTELRQFKELSPILPNSTYSNLYQVTACYKENDFFYQFKDKDNGNNGYTRSSSITISRDGYFYG